MSVIVCVYNTMPYLTRCLASLARQSIGPDRMEIIAVDDGSTDGGGAELDRFAARQPGPVRVVHQPNSGGPAAPSNRALGLATGRYVFFLGADDHLGPEALHRLVVAADDLGADVVLGRLIGADGRYVDQQVFERNDPDVDLFDSALPWALSNTKLFRRDLVERHALRYPEGLSVGSDQPFTFAACLYARRIAVLADYDFYHAVRRADGSNITYRTSPDEHLRCAEFIMDFVAGLVPAGPRRDAVLLRHFTWELGKLLRDDFLTLDRPAQERLVAGIRALADRYLSDGVRTRLEPDPRIRLSLAQFAGVDDLVAAITQESRRPAPPIVVEGRRCYARYHGFRDPRLALPESWFDVTDHAATLLARFEARSVAWAPADDGTRVLAISAYGPMADLAAVAVEGIRILARPAGGSLAGEPDAGCVPATSHGSTGSALLTRIPVGPLLPRVRSGGRLWTVQTEVTAFGETGSGRLRGPFPAEPRRLLCRRGLRWYVATATTGASGGLVVAVTPLGLGRLVGFLARAGRLLWRGPRRRRATPCR